MFLHEAFVIAAETPNLKPFFQRKAFTLMARQISKGNGFVTPIQKPYKKSVYLQPFIITIMILISNNNNNNDNNNTSR